MTDLTPSSTVGRCPENNFALRSPHPFDFTMKVILCSKKVKQGNKLKRTYLYACWSCIRGTICKYENGTPKMARNAFNIGEVWNPVCCHGNKTVNCGEHLVESYCKESNLSDTNWLRYFFHRIWLKFGWVYDAVTWLICIFWKLHLWNKKRYLK